MLAIRSTMILTLVCSFSFLSTANASDPMMTSSVATSP